MTDLVIRRATWEDADALWPLRLALHVADATYSGTTCADSPKDLAIVKNHFESLLLDGSVFVVAAFLDDLAAGYVMFSGRRLYGYDESVNTVTVASLYVLPEARFGQVGYRLIRAGFAAAHGFDAIQFCIGHGNRAVHRAVRGMGAKPLSTVYEMEMPHGLAVRRTRRGNESAKERQEQQPAGDQHAERRLQQIHG